MSFVTCTTTGSRTFQSNLVKKRATFDLDCQDVSLTNLGNATYGANGCGKRKTYIVICDGGIARTDLCNAVDDTGSIRTSQ